MSGTVHGKFFQGEKKLSKNAVKYTPGQKKYQAKNGTIFSGLSIILTILITNQ